MRTERAGAAAIALSLVVMGACNGGDGGSTAVDCGVPTPDPAARDDLNPEQFLLDGEAAVASAGRRRGGVTAVLSVPLSVQDALPRYREAVGDASFDVVSEDNEGFEAELYLKRGKRLGAIQIRRTLCEDVSIVFVNVVQGDFAMPIATSPSPSAP